jgi:UDP-glucose 4-epimerase
MVNGIIQSAQQIVKTDVNVIYLRRLIKRITGRRPGDPAVLIADSYKAKSILCWQAKYDLESIIRTAWNWEQKRCY